MSIWKLIKGIFTKDANGEKSMNEGNDTLNLSASPNLEATVGEVPDGPSTMSTTSAQRQIEQQAKMASMATIPGQIKNRDLEKRPMAQFAGNYEQPPVGNAYSPQQMMRQPQMQQRNVQQPQYSPDYGAVGHMYPQQQMPPPQPYYPPQQMPPQQPYYTQQAPQMSNEYGAAFAEVIATSNNEYECWIDLPGIDTDKLGVVVRENALHVTGERKLHSEVMGTKKGKRGTKALAVQSSVPNYLLNKFNFTFPFVKPVDEDNIQAEYVNGQLHIILAILSSAKGVKVNVNFKPI